MKKWMCSIIWYRRMTSPFLDGIAERGLVFRECIVNGAGTFASFTALMTSSYPFMNGTFERINRVTLAEVLNRNGFYTIGINDNAFLSPYFGFDRGFDEYICLVERRRIRDLIGRLVQLKLGGDLGMSGKVITKIAVKALRRFRGVDVFMWIHYMDVHGPHYAPKWCYKSVGDYVPKFRELLRLNRKLSRAESLYKEGKIGSRDVELLKLTYDAEIRYVDRCIQTLFEEVKRLGLLKDTYFVITGDHGEEFFEHGGYHSNLNLYEEMIRVPLIIYGPDIPAKVVSGQVRHIDIAPTILEIAGVKYSGFIGKSLLGEDCTSPIAITEAAYYRVGKRIVEMSFWDRKTSIRLSNGSRRLKYISCMKTGKEELYDLNIDPGERVNLAGDDRYAEDIEEFRRILKRHLESERERACIKRLVRRIRK